MSPADQETARPGGERSTEGDGARPAVVNAQCFDLNGTPLLSSGRTDTAVAIGNDMVARVKVYASGGENATHAHVDEEHMFLVLAGQARFHLGRDGEDQVDIGPNAGVFLPVGSFYRFESTGSDNLVLLRIGQGRHGETRRIGADGQPLAGGSAKNMHAPGIERPGAFFGMP